MAGIYEETVEVTRRSMVLFFIVDTSGSMAGSKIGAVNNAIREVLPEITKISSSNADAEIKIAAMSFSTGVEWQTRQPQPVADFIWDDMTAEGMTDLGAACKALDDKLSRNAFMQEVAGSYAPAIFLMSDGQPTDNYKKGLAQLKENKWFQNAIRVAIAIGDDANKEILTEFTGTVETVLTAHTPEALASMIKLVSVRASEIGSTSKRASSEGDSPTTKMQDFAKVLQDEIADDTSGEIVDDFD